MSQQTEEELGVDRINSLKDFSIDVDLRIITDIDESALNLVGSWQQKSGELLKIEKGSAMHFTMSHSTYKVAFFISFELPMNNNLIFLHVFA